MSKELKTPAEVAEAKEKDREEQATFFSLGSLTRDEIACLTSRVFDKFGSDFRLYDKVFQRSVDYYDLVVLISILEERFHYLSSLPVSEYPFLIPDFTRCESALNKLKNMLADESTELNSSESEPEEKDREEEVTFEQVEEKEDYLPNVFGLEDLNGCGIRFNVIEMRAIRKSISYSVCSTHPDEPYYEELCFLEKLFDRFFERSSFLKYEKSTQNDKLLSVSEDVFNDDELPF